MNEGKTRFDGVGALGELIGGVLQNPTVIEAVIAGVSALAASRRVKNKDSPDSDGAGGLLDMLPRIIPLLGLFRAADGEVPSVSALAESEAAADESGNSHEISAEPPDETPAPDDGGVSDVMSLVDSLPSEASDANMAEDNREQLLLAIKPYLSESRRSAADAMISVNRISGLFRG
ncbi:MAG: hypothetical protein LUH43_03610 [Clostridia bacterium]|nr:hypothetical protein [Clostridia bacterium]